jgi:hypothetical protein
MNESLEKKNIYSILIFDLFFSNVLLPINLGFDIKSRKGTGIFLVIYSQITSILYLSCALIGIIGAPSAFVPIRRKKNFPNEKSNSIFSNL